jgi:sarcosine reductase
MQHYEVRDMLFGEKTFYSKGILTIDRKALFDLLSDDPKLHNIDIQIAKPGEETRIVNILDLSEPRIKPDGGDYYPGLFGPLRRAGQGKTNALKGIAVLETGIMQGLPGNIIDMSGPGALLTPFSKTINLCISANPAPSDSLVDYCMALKRAGMKTAVYLAKSTVGVTPTETMVYDLGRDADCPASLPRVAYLYQLHNHGDAREPFIYGQNSSEFFPTTLHPTEILDGAIVSFHYNASAGVKNVTYAVVNHPVILELYRRHGKELNFVGVVIAPEPSSLPEKKLTAMMSGTLLKETLHAQGVIISKEGGGHTDVDIMANCEECENLGIKTVLIDNEWLGPDGTNDLPLICISPYADAMVSVGNIEEMIELPAMNRVIGGDHMPEVSGNPREKLNVSLTLVPCAISQIGLTNLRTEVW